MNRYRGSYKRMRELVLDQNKHLIEEMINEPIVWICPQIGNDAELQLNGKGLMKLLDLPENFFDGFWPRRAPQWDGLFISKVSKTLYLIEAKSHITEISKGNYEPKSGVRNYETKIYNYNMKCNSLRNVMKYFNVNDDRNNYWLHHYYQIANRLAFLLKIKEACPNKEIKDAKLIFLNFVNDPDWLKSNKQASDEEWNKKYETILNKMGITEIDLSDNDAFIWNIDLNLKYVHPFCTPL